MTTAVQALLAPLAGLYGLGAYARLLSYSLGIKSRKKADAFVVSVGNLTVGGTGKSPVVIDIAARLSRRGLKVAVLSRGYGRRSKAPYVVVSDGSGKPLCSVEESGDEPYLIATAVPAACVIVGASRVQTQALAIQKYGAEVLILDDGFQHLPMERDMDLVLWDYNDDPGTAKLLPAGRLREPFSALSRASHIVVTKVPEVPDPAYLEGLLKTLRSYNPEAEMSTVSFLIDCVVNAPDLGRSLPPSELSGKRWLALSAIARPESFQASLRQLALDVVEVMTRPDHSWFSERDIRQLSAALESGSVDGVITTEKDLVRLLYTGDEMRRQQLSRVRSKIYALRQTTVWHEEAEPAFLTRIKA
ncbi:MAG: tetraacyldisaccharide 4'-kinase [Candidatus Obscuribacter sp.]|nr:tetraacyldisaccharide 4'-kinase [Candidatus Obscuribacter sp.]